MTRAIMQGIDAPARVLTFPLPSRLGARAVAWIEAEVDAWSREQIAASCGSTGVI